ncbi:MULTISPECIES: helix-turn-helix domain-containing protein [unclassified Imperialibacter]|uniref:helix-turn-helix domain-containing protein n=1 Tax=unclassified Imperialibacter TaxID=2629706 RepID=UPI00125393F0|nr:MULTISPECIES: helix-turn-helix domain-containing protein [unclassified Imperialibacter]CAD5255136.1 Helix-turn-helix protein [Imperialibacter sp. 89]CAD5256474.1 Helix-turn-helix protein [Imperialibacter sp. 75]VVT20177.1 AraC family transcriptional regulator [Imperialibacter sp. EC-SDR9]
MFYLAGIILTFFLAVLLITKKAKSEADLILAAWLTAIGFHLCFFYLTFSDQFLSFPFLLGFNFPLPLLHGPFLFLYTSALTNQNTPAKYKAAHFIPFVLLYGLFLPFILLPEEQKVEVFKNEGSGYEVEMLVMISSIMISGVVYVGLSLWKLNEHKKTIQDQFSSAEKINLAWLRYLIYGIGLIWLFVLFAEDVMIFNAVVVFVFFLGYFGIRQVGIFSQGYPTPEKLLPATALAVHGTATPGNPVSGQNNKPAAPKYQRSGLSDEAAAKLHSSLGEIMEKEKLYTNTELTLTELAKALDVHPHYLSQVINTFEGKTFYDYINTLRVEEFKRLVALPESKKFTLLALALDCGFNSKTSFNRNFKSVTGLAPSEYLKRTTTYLHT